MQNKKIVFLASDCNSSRWVFNALKEDFDFSRIIIERPVSKKLLFRRRIKKLGLFKVVGQALFSLLAVPVLRYFSKKRIDELVSINKLNNADFTEGYYKVNSVNDERCMELLKQINPDIVVVNGTRIISKTVLKNIPARFINMHVGITPRYRGSHGGYWAIYNNDVANFGTTIHLVDAGVDTGLILKQAHTSPAIRDNFTTYPVLQTAIGINALKEVLAQDDLSGNKIEKSTEKGILYYQPTLWQYLFSKTK